MNLPAHDVQVVFLVHLPVVDPVTEYLAVTGSSEALGDSKAADALEATYSGSATWRAVATIPSESTVFWKWLVISRTTKEALRWEENPNRELVTMDDDLLIESQWNGQEIIKALYSEKRRKVLKMERRTLEEIALRNASVEKENFLKNKNAAKSWNKNNSYHSIHTTESGKPDTCTKKSRSAAHLKVRFADDVKSTENQSDTSEDDTMKVNIEKEVKALRNGSSVDNNRARRPVWKKIADYGIPVGLISGTAALSIFMFRKLL